MIIDSVVVRLFRATAIAICPFILVDPKVEDRARKRLLVHEWVHWHQQFVFGVIFAVLGLVIWVFLSWPPQSTMALTAALGLVEGWVVGQILWRAVYLLCLPVGFNPFRRRWETEAFRAQGLGDDEIRDILREPPYYLR